MHNDSRWGITKHGQKSLLENETISASSIPTAANPMLANGDPGLWPSNHEPFLRNQSPVNVKQNELSIPFLDPEIAMLYSRSRSQEEEIFMLRKQIVDASANELQSLNEKHVLERKLIDLQMALDEKHHNAVSDALKDLTHRKGYLEENLKLADELRALNDERYMFTSSLLGLLSDYGIRPPVVDASSICSGIKRLNHQFQSKIRFSQVANPYGYQQYNQNPHDAHMELLSNQPRFVNDQEMMDAKDTNAETYYTFMGNKTRDTENQMPSNSFDGRTDEPVNQKTNHVIPNERHNNASYDSEGELLPGIESFQIIGEATPGSTLTGCGFPCNGTSLCIFQWVWHLQDGRRQYIEGATNPEYVVTADDVEKIIAVECIPIDDGGRQGKLVKQFANNQNKITCDPDMEHKIQRYLSEGGAVFNVLLLKDPAENWEPTILTLNLFSYQIKIKHMEVLVMEKEYSSDLFIKVPYGLSTQFVLTCSDGTSHPFSTEGTSYPPSTEIDIRQRDIIVLTIRKFQQKVLDKKRGKAHGSVSIFNM